MNETIHPLLIETVIAVVGLAVTYFAKQKGDSERVKRFRENHAMLYEFVEEAVEAVEQKSLQLALGNEEKYELVFDRTKSFVDNSLSKYNLDNRKITDEYIDTLIEYAVGHIKGRLNG